MLKKLKFSVEKNVENCECLRFDTDKCKFTFLKKFLIYIKVSKMLLGMNIFHVLMFTSIHTCFANCDIFICNAELAKIVLK